MKDLKLFDYKEKNGVVYITPKRYTLLMVGIGLLCYSIGYLTNWLSML